MAGALSSSNFQRMLPLNVGSLPRLNGERPGLNRLCRRRSGQGFSAESGRGDYPGAMRGAELLDVEFAECGKRPLDTVSIGFQEVHAAEYGVDGAATGDQPDVVQRVHNAGVSAANKTTTPSRGSKNIAWSSTRESR